MKVFDFYVFYMIHNMLISYGQQFIYVSIELIA